MNQQTTQKHVYVSKVYRQHNSCATTIPKAVCKALDLGPKDAIIWEIRTGKKQAVVLGLEGWRPARMGNGED